MITKWFVVALAITTVSAWREQVELEGAKAYTVHPTTEKLFSVLKDFYLKSGGIDFIQLPRAGREGKVVVAKETQRVFESLLEDNEIPFSVYMEDVKTIADQEIKANEAAKKKSEGRFDFSAYHDHETINKYLDELPAKYPGKVKVVDAGKSFENKTIKLIEISTTGGTDLSKPVIIADAGNHAREWIGPAQAMYIIRKLVEDITENDIVNDIDWVIIPVLNPDGYEYAMKTNRMWRKTRSTHASSICPGVDGNRNFGFQWMFSGSSSNPCSDIYAGPEEFSESESKVLRDTVMKYQSRAKAYMAIHSFGSFILYPYGYNGEPTPDNALLHSVSENMAKAINDVIGQQSKPYTVGNAGGSSLGYAASGATEDWAYAVGNIKLSYTFELQGGSTNGFDLPPDRIQDVVKETWEGMVVLAKYVIQQNKP